MLQEYSYLQICVIIVLRNRLTYHKKYLLAILETSIFNEFCRNWFHLCGCGQFKLARSGMNQLYNSFSLVGSTRLITGSHLVLQTYKPDPDSEELAWDLHFWIGSKSSQVRSRDYHAGN